MEPNPYESPRVPDGLEVRDGLVVRVEEVGGVPYWSFLDVVIVCIILGVIAALLTPAVMR